MGIRFGLDPVCHISRNWRIYGNVALRALYQNYNTKEAIEIKGFGGATAGTVTSVDDYTFRNTKKAIIL